MNTLDAVGVFAGEQLLGGHLLTSDACVCDAGHFFEARAGQATGCWLCPAGKFQPDRAREECEGCAAGQERHFPVKPPP